MKITHGILVIDPETEDIVHMCYFGSKPKPVDIRTLRRELEEDADMKLPRPLHSYLFEIVTKDEMLRENPELADQFEEWEQ